MWKHWKDGRLDSSGVWSESPFPIAGPRADSSLTTPAPGPPLRSEPAATNAALAGLPPGPGGPPSRPPSPPTPAVPLAYRSAPPPSARGGERSASRHATRTARCRHRLWRSGCAQPAPSPARPAPRLSLAPPRSGGGEEGGLRLADWPTASATHRGRHFVPFNLRGRGIAAPEATPLLELRARSLGTGAVTLGGAPPL